MVLECRTNVGNLVAWIPFRCYGLIGIGVVAQIDLTIEEQQMFVPCEGIANAGISIQVEVFATGLVVQSFAVFVCIGGEIGMVGRLEHVLRCQLTKDAKTAGEL